MAGLLAARGGLCIFTLEGFGLVIAAVLYQNYLKMPACVNEEERRFTFIGEVTFKDLLGDAD